MKVKLTESFRIRIMLYTCISLLAAVLVDMAVLLFCIRSRILVSDYGLNEKINLHAQKRAMGFYEKLGFITVSDEFLEEGVVHVSMEREI